MLGASIHQSVRLWDSRHAQLETASGHRNGAVDAVRFVGAGAIVWFHVGAPGGSITLAALPMFMALTVHYGLRGAEAASLRELASRRARRLLVPWAGWSLIYALGKIADALAAGAPLSSEFASFMLLTGPQLHLWFLPFAYVAVLASGVALSCIPRGRSGTIWLLAGYMAISIVALAGYTVAKPGPPLAQWLTTIPAVMLGMILLRSEKDRLALWLMPGASAAVFVVTVALGFNGVAFGNLLAALILFSCFVCFVRASAWTIMASQLALGIYLVHPLVVAIVERVSDVPRGTPAKAIAVVAVALVATAALRRTPVLRRFV